ncbi:MAG TPA: hypothetical protein VHC98_01375 [Candidatus Saccharimonadales bacterium]|nr:hypothetical protein [Candidatus Saccharimonadales bacterium]
MEKLTTPSEQEELTQLTVLTEIDDAPKLVAEITPAYDANGNVVNGTLEEFVVPSHEDDR